MTEPKTALNKSNLSLWTLVMLIFVPTFGFSNITTNGVALGPATVALVTVAVSIAGFVGAGIDYYIDAETGTEAIQAILMTYGGPPILIALGFGLSAANRLQTKMNPRILKE